MTTTYHFIKSPGKDEKLAPQARLLLGHVEKAGKSGIKRQELVDKLQADQKSGTTSARQDAGKIIGFYQKPMEEAGFWSIERAPQEKKVKTPKAPKEKATVGKKKEKVAA